MYMYTADDCLPTNATPLEALTAEKVIVNVSQLLQLVRVCLHERCSKKTTIMQRFVGATLVMTITCSNRHKYMWCSSPQHYNKKGIPIFYINLFLAASCLISGNAYQKVMEMMKFLGLKSISNSTLHRYQSTYFVPAIEKFWYEHQKVVLSEHNGRGLVVFGDGRCDSPGSSAALCTYTVMDNDSRAILSTITVTKSEVINTYVSYPFPMFPLYTQVDYKSPNMERLALKNCLSSLLPVVKIEELATDASSSIIAMVGK